MNTDTAGMTLRGFKKMRRYHKKLRKNILHREMLQTIDKLVKNKQKIYFAKQAEAFSSQIFKILNQLNNRRKSA